MYLLEMFCSKNILMLIFAGDVDTSGNVDNAGFLPVFPPTKSNDTGKSSGKKIQPISWGSPLQNFYLHKVSSKGNFKNCTANGFL